MAKYMEEIMSVPDFQTLMLPRLRVSADGNEHSITNTCSALAAAFHLTEADLRELPPSGKQSRFTNRIAWAKAYLQRTGLVERTGRGRYRITERGRQVIESQPASINLKYLERFPELKEFRRRKGERPSDDTEEIAEAEEQGTPEEVIESKYQELRRSLADVLLERIKMAPPRFFEQLVVDLLVAMGYGGSRRDAGRAVGGSGDGGIDGIIKEDRLGLDAVYVQAKKWEGVVGRPVVQAFAGSLEGQRARKGVMITTSSFSKDAREFVKGIEKRIVLIDGDELTQLMIDHGIGVADIATYAIKRIDLDYFEEE